MYEQRQKQLNLTRCTVVHHCLMRRETRWRSGQLLRIGAWEKTNDQLLHSSRLKLPNSPAADVIGAESAAGEPVGPRARASTGSREDAVPRSRLHDADPGRA